MAQQLLPEPQTGAEQMISSEPAFKPSTEIPLSGRYVTLTALKQRNIPELWDSLQSTSQSVFHFLPWKTPQNAIDFQNTIEQIKSRGFILFAIYANSSRLSANETHEVPDSNRHTEILGMIGYLDISPSSRALELGAVLFGPILQRTTAATEAHYLMLKYAFEGNSHSTQPTYRRVSWKCNSANSASRKAAERLGFTYEGTFRNHMVVRGVSRDSDWLSIIDEEWLPVKKALETWLDDSNFTADGKQLRTLKQIREEMKTMRNVMLVWYGMDS
ncbi:hypothetical protein KCU85_g4029, partial [Aureobasidium melanogenum]